MTREPVYLRPASYRRRRRRDAARLLPFVGAFLFLLPVLWGPARGAPRDTAQDGIYLFVTWAALIVLAALISRSLRGQAEGGDPQTDLASDPTRDPTRDPDADRASDQSSAGAAPSDAPPLRPE
jgi:hypothetical protein